MGGWQLVRQRCFKQSFVVRVGIKRTALEILNADGENGAFRQELLDRGSSLSLLDVEVIGSPGVIGNPERFDSFANELSDSNGILRGLLVVPGWQDAFAQVIYPLKALPPGQV